MFSRADRLRVSEGTVIDPRNRNCPDVVKYAATRGFKIIHYTRFRGQYRVRHRLGKVDFFVWDLNDIRPCDLDVFD